MTFPSERVRDSLVSYTVQVTPDNMSPCGDGSLKLLVTVQKEESGKSRHFCRNVRYSSHTKRGLGAS